LHDPSLTPSIIVVSIFELCILSFAIVQYLIYFCLFKLTYCYLLKCVRIYHPIHYLIHFLLCYVNVPKKVLVFELAEEILMQRGLWV
jgi:hypothetical protein